MDCLRKFVDPFSMVLVQIINTGIFLLSKVALDRGVFIYAFLSYRCIIAAICILPVAVMVERKNFKRPTWSVFCWIFFSALLGIPLALGMYNYGLRDTNATYSACFLNLVPVVTYILAVAARMESLDLNSQAGKMKILGTLVCVGGALVIILYKGMEVHMWPKHIKEANKMATDQVVVAHHQMRGTLLLIISCLSMAAWFIVQVKVFTVYPFKFTVTMLTCAVGSLQTAILGIILNREKDAWKLGWDLRLLLVMYSGMLSTGAVFCLVTRVITKRGPTYPNMFNCLSLAFTTLLEALFMDQELTVGGLLGMSMIVAGLYSYLWAKGKEKKSPPKESSVRDVELAHDSAYKTDGPQETNCNKDVISK